MSGFEEVSFPSGMRTTALPQKPKAIPKETPIGPEYIEEVVPPTSFQLLDRTTGLDIAREFEAKRKAADECICRDALIYLEAGLHPIGVAEVIRMRWGAEHGVTKEKIDMAVSLAVELLKQKEKSHES